MAMRYNDKGEEIPDDTPIEVPVHFRRPPSIQELIAMHVRAQFQVERAMGKEDENDFSEESDGDDILTPYELDAHVADADAEIRRAEQSKAVLDKYKKRKDSGGTVNKDRGDKDGFDEDSKRVGSDVSAGKADSRAKGTGSEVARGSKEEDRGAVER